MVKLRNAVAHGDLSVDIQEEQVKGLLKQLRAIAADIEAACNPERGRDVRTS